VSKPRRLSPGQRAVETVASVVVLGPLALVGAALITAGEIADRCPDPRLVLLLAREHLAARLQRPR